MKKSIFLFLIFLLPAIAFSQETDKNKLAFSLKGFVKNDMFWDTRQTVSPREGHFLLFPKPIKLDADGNDINQGMNFNFLSLQSRISVNIEGTQALGADVSGKIEGDFFAQKDDNINLFRLRHAYFKLNWTSTELLLGQTWIPMFITDCFPGTISFNTGTPFQPFGRNPQIRLTHELGVAKFIAIASSQRDYASRGISGASGEYLRNSAIPEISGQIHVSPIEPLLVGINGSYKQIKPQLVTPQGYKTDELVGGFNAMAFAKIETKAITLKLQGVYGQNMPDVLSIGGFAISDTTDATKGFVKYVTLNTASAWVDFQTNGDFSVGVFGGYSMNMGATKDIIAGTTYGLGTNIESMYRISPRVSYKINSVKFALEGEYTVANYGSTFSNKGIPENLTEANNFRVLFATYYLF